VLLDPGKVLDQTKEIGSRRDAWLPFLVLGEALGSPDHRVPHLVQVTEEDIVL
jgi:hypothetical protein